MSVLKHRNSKKKYMYIYIFGQLLRGHHDLLNNPEMVLKIIIKIFCNNENFIEFDTLTWFWIRQNSFDRPSWSEA